MKRLSILLSLLLLLPTAIFAQQAYEPTPENLQSRHEFADMRFGIFIHWGLYSMFAQGEWYMQNAGIPFAEYSKAASAFYPANFDAAQWVAAIKASGAGYVTFT